MDAPGEIIVLSRVLDRLVTCGVTIKVVQVSGTEALGYLQQIEASLGQLAEKVSLISGKVDDILGYEKTDHPDPVEPVP